jgi:hypothetical protein
MVKASVLGSLVLLTLSCSLMDDDKNDDSEGSGADGSGAQPSGSGGSTGAPIQLGGNGSGLVPGNTGGQGNGSGQLDPGSADALREQACADWSHEPELLPVVVQLVVDVSLSMNERTRATNGRTKWEITREALEEAVANLPESSAVGVLYYPNRATSSSDRPLDVSACVNTSAMIPIAPLGRAGSAQRQTIADSLGRAQPNGSTPTHDAYRYALQNGLEPSREPGNRYMILITDGAPTLALECQGEGTPQYPQPTQPIIDDMYAARQEGIRTFVIGSPGSEVSVNGGDARPWMAQAAVLGGTARPGCSVIGPDFCHIDLTQTNDFAASLRSALAEVTGAIASCVYELPEVDSGRVLDLGAINVIYTPPSGEAELIGRNDAPDCQEGWQIQGNNVVLCGATCDLVQSDPSATLELLFGCESNPIKVR